MNGTCQVVCFFEDNAHEQFIKALIKRVAEEENLNVQIKVLNATHGSKVWSEFQQYLRELKAGGMQLLPDVLVVAIDGNCRKAARVRKDIQQEVKKFSLSIPHLVCAVPDPHIERWYLEDQQAFKNVIPESQPKKLSYKCERGRYKQALVEAIRAAGIEPLGGGVEYGEDIAYALNPKRLDRSFQTFWRDLRAAFKE